MAIDDDGADMAAFSIDVGLRIKDMFCRFIDTNGDLAIGYHLFPLGYHIRRQGFQDLEACISITAQSPDSSGNSQSWHAGSRNHDAHPIFIKLAETKALTDCTGSPNSFAAVAAAKAREIGSVHPVAGLISCFMISIILFHIVQVSIIITPKKSIYEIRYKLTKKPGMAR